MPRPTIAQLVLLELAAAAAAGGIAWKGKWLILGLAAAVVLLVLAAAPIGGRWLYQLALSFLAMARRRRQVRGPGLQSLLGGYQVTTVPAGRQGAPFGAVTVGNTWTVPIEIGLDRVLNDDAPVPVAGLTDLLQVEDVPLASVRLVTVVTPAPRGQGPALPAAPAPTVVARYVLLTLDLAQASGAVAARGGSNAAVAQILRRCAIRADEVLTANGLMVRRLDEAAVAALFAAVIGPSAAAPGGAIPRTVEGWREIKVAGTWSVSFAVTGGGADLTDRLTTLAASVPTPIAVTSLVLRASVRGGVAAHLILRVSGPGQTPDRSVAALLTERAREMGMTLQRLDGEQGAMLRATTPVGVGAAQ